LNNIHSLFSAEQSFLMLSDNLQGPYKAVTDWLTDWLTDWWKTDNLFIVLVALTMKCQADTVVHKVFINRRADYKKQDSFVETDETHIYK
jgi:hypothetical protein